MNPMRTHEEKRAYDRTFSAAWRERNKEHIKRYNDEYRLEHAKEIKTRRRGRYEQLFKEYGSTCQCPCGCKQSNKMLLTLGHIHHDGAEDRKNNGGNIMVQWKAIKHPDHERYTILCYDCNCGTERNGRVCPKVKT